MVVMLFNILSKNDKKIFDDPPLFKMSNCYKR